MFGFFENEQTRRVKSHLMNLVALAKADGHMDEREMSFIMAVGKRGGLRTEEVRSIMGNSSAINLLIPDNDSERFDQIFDLVDMMLADGIVDDTEINFCVDMAEKLGFRKEVVTRLVRHISQCVKDGMERDQIKDDALALLRS
ncbi:TerB family tellurite resistance protein [Hymenobacter endophyticus]|uniref:TerB family tellurite resistance protein n=1 Tax=Hymenobacter endophyticus TaxID=3076335 RepID=A0ABU3TMZ7_9BACT|nr:TerB family tellurite resistance protein [Hymenobacter endophyticus]MDU0372758.1 TerB family tellurite resistance protein [Hymenobacter endophyticus]